jgi:hypothetical protein
MWVAVILFPPTSLAIVVEVGGARHDFELGMRGSGAGEGCRDERGA